LPAVRYRLRFPRERLTTFATAHAPVGGTNADGKQFTGGEFVPSKANGEQQASEPKKPGKKALAWATKLIDKIPGAKKLREVTQKIKAKMVKRYGVKKVAAAIAVGQGVSWAAFAGGLAVGMTVWVPSAVPAAIFLEMQHQLKGVKSPDLHVRKLAGKLVDGVQKAWKKIQADLKATGEPMAR